MELVKMILNFHFNNTVLIVLATARPVGRYINTLFRRQFTKENLNKALGQKYDLISYIDYGYHLLEEKIQMFKTFEKIYVACNLTITDDFKYVYVLVY